MPEPKKKLPWYAWLGQPPPASKEAMRKKYGLVSREEMPSGFESWLTPATRTTMATPEYLAWSARQQEAAAGGWKLEDMPRLPTPTPTPTPTPMGKPTEPLTHEQASAIQQLLGVDYTIDYDEELGGYTVQRGRALPAAPTGKPERLYRTYEEASVASFEGYRPVQTAEGWWAIEPDPKYVKQPTGTYKTYAEAESAAPAGFRPVQYPSGYWGFERAETTTPAEQAQMDYYSWQREDAAANREAQKQQQLAQLRANPASWLEYASLAGTTPAIQPWMVPLGQQYNMQAGQAIPGYQAGGERMNLPQLTSPSRQYQARAGPTAMAQYGGYERARSGITPEELQFRLWSSAPPGGRTGGLTWQR